MSYLEIEHDGGGLFGFTDSRFHGVPGAIGWLAEDGFAYQGYDGAERAAARYSERVGAARQFALDYKRDHGDWPTAEVMLEHGFAEPPENALPEVVSQPYPWPGMMLGSPTAEVSA